MLASIDIKLIGVIGLLFIIAIGYFVYSLYKDLVFLKNEVSEMNNLILDDSWNSVEDRTREEKSDEEQDRELEEHLRSFLETQGQETPRVLETIEELPEDEPVLLETPEEQKPKKRKYNKKKNEEQNTEEINFSV